jgi:hypothetical protein
MLALGPRHTPHSYLYTANSIPPCLLRGRAILHTRICIRPISQGFRHACLGRCAILHTRICIRPILQGFRHACFGAPPYSTLVFVYGQYVPCGMQMSPQGH